ncbi:MAG TPA: hypothetical protein VHC86_12375 [Opitutaceae bacterium]|nr:hypothetical protein [Opitutaceae bacterium]
MSLPRLSLFAAALGLAGVPARAQLADSSPFLPAGVAGGTSTDASALELRGILVGPEGTRYDIYDPAKKSGTWAGVGERGHDFTIRSAEGDLSNGGRLVVQAAGRTYPLTLKTARASASGPVAPRGLIGAASMNGNVPADEAQRLAAVAEEVRRRRQLRDQATQGGAQPAETNAAQAGAPGRGRRQQGR